MTAQPTDSFIGKGGRARGRDNDTVAPKSSTAWELMDAGMRTKITNSLEAA
jgi:hypothetical protein